MSEEKFDLDRENNIEANVDATGKKWVIHFNRMNGLCYARPKPDRSDAVIPESMQGQWTKPSLLEPIIKKHVISSWDKADRARAVAEQKAKIAKERKKAAKALPKELKKAKRDTGSTTE